MPELRTAEDGATKIVPTHSDILEVANLSYEDHLLYMNECDPDDPAEYYEALINLKAAELLCEYAELHAPEELKGGGICPRCYTDHTLNLDVFGPHFFCPACSQHLLNPKPVTASTLSKEDKPTTQSTKDSGNTPLPLRL